MFDSLTPFDVLTVITAFIWTYSFWGSLAIGIVWALDAGVRARRRRTVVRQADGTPDHVGVAPPSRFVEYSKRLLPVFLILFFLRVFFVSSLFVYGPSMTPTLLDGDVVFVAVYEYDNRPPERGDIVVFRNPDASFWPADLYVKRVVGVPGDRIGYYDKVLYLNGKPINQRPVGRYVGLGSGAAMSGASLRVERIAAAEYTVLVDPRARSFDFETAMVPGRHYFVLGDNRDMSTDSRDFGFVSEDRLTGKVFRIWMHWEFGHGLDRRRTNKAID